MFKRTMIVGFVALSLTAGCEDPAKDKPKATVGSAAPAEAAKPGASAAASADGEKLAFDGASGSKLEFVGSKVTGKHEGKFEKFSGVVTLASGKIEGGKVHVDIDATSATTDQGDLDKHLLSADFFDAEKFPKATFDATEIKPGGEKGASHTLSGTLEIRGVKKSISFPATITVGAKEVTAKSEFSINRKDFGIVFEGKKDDLIRDDVLIKLDLKAPRKT